MLWECHDTLAAGELVNCRELCPEKDDILMQLSEEGCFEPLQSVPSEALSGRALTVEWPLSPHSAKIKNIISTEDAKARLLAEQQNKKKDSETSFVPTNMAVNYVQHNRCKRRGPGAAAPAPLGSGAWAPVLSDAPPGLFRSSLPRGAQRSHTEKQRGAQSPALASGGHREAGAWAWVQQGPQGRGGGRGPGLVEAGRGGAWALGPRHLGSSSFSGPWLCAISFPSLSFLTFKMGLVIKCTTGGCSKDSMGYQV